jgi:hypothetical protein
MLRCPVYIITRNCGRAQIVAHNCKREDTYIWQYWTLKHACLLGKVYVYEKNRLVVLENHKHGAITRVSNFTFFFYFCFFFKLFFSISTFMSIPRDESIGPHKNLYISVHSNVIYDSQKMKTTQMCQRMNGQSVL